ncbi:FAD/NAD(P)-binding domain-containing protein [Mycena chlorophos]|uniref:FAD/NAD(P)-binding domain-containing protein n=1 Tax=Mycena chlorophos TaxID=658473 RepID=A0A8H6WGH6_MYCCL|nr:FAD/NAD(P)-binding domain-containing protein [Mycena chlorophos]
MATNKFRNRLHNFEEEDASQLKLGTGKSHSRSWSSAHARVPIAKKSSTTPVVSSSRRSSTCWRIEIRMPRIPRVSVYNKTLEYVKTFAKFNTTDSASAVRETLRREPGLTQFETAQIANLCPATADEAKSVVPSLVKIDDDRLDALLRDIQTMRKYQS